MAVCDVDAAALVVVVKLGQIGGRNGKGESNTQKSKVAI